MITYSKFFYKDHSYFHVMFLFIDLLWKVKSSLECLNHNWSAWSKLPLVSVFRSCISSSYFRGWATPSPISFSSLNFFIKRNDRETKKHIKRKKEDIFIAEQLWSWNFLHILATTSIFYVSHLVAKYLCHLFKAHKWG